MAHLYDLVLMLDPTAPEGRGEQILGDVRSMIETSGTPVGEHDWGLRKMTFEIRHRPEAHYTLFQFEGDNELLERVDHMLKITDGVLRFRIFKTDADSPVMVPPDTEQIMRRDEDERGRGREGGRGSRRRFDEDSGGDRGRDRGSAEPAPAAAGADSE